MEIKELLQNLDLFIKKSKAFNDFKFVLYKDLSFHFIKEDSTGKFVFGHRVSESKKGLFLGAMSGRVRINQIENFLQPIIINNNLNFEINSFTLYQQESEIKRKIDTYLISNDSNMNEVFSLLQGYLNNEVLLFFSNSIKQEYWDNFIQQISLDQLLEKGFGGEYPINILKAITIAKWCNNETKYQEYKQGLQTWIDEDRNDPNYSQMCDSYQNALDELVQKLETEI